MKLKGHATIELTDINTGEKVVHEDDNIITNAIKNLLGFQGMFNCTGGSNAVSYNTAELYSPLRRLTNGLLLFDSMIEEDVETVYPPAGVSLVGCASGISYNGANAMAGSYNKQESGKIDGGYKHVWDFGTSQANGQIACACLTTMAGGKITSGSFPLATDYMYKTGDGTDTVEEILFKSNNNEVYVTKCETQQNSNHQTAQAILFLDGKRNRILKASSEYYFYPYYDNTSDQKYFQKSIFYNKAIDIDIERLGVTSFSIFDSPKGDAMLRTLPYGELVQETVHVEMPDGLKAKITDDMLNNTGRYFALSSSCDDNYIYFAIKLATTSNSNYVVEKNEKFYVWKINVETFESSYFEVTNTTNEAIWFQSGSYYGLSDYNGETAIAMFDDYLLCAGYSSKKVYCLKLTDNTDVAEVKMPDGSSFLANESYCLGFVIYQSGAGKVSLSTQPMTNTNGYFVIDPVLKIATYKNIQTSYMWQAGAYYYNYTRKVMHIAGTILLTYVFADNFYCKLSPFIDPALLITINNLSSPVLKTASQTMKVTYTLTQVVEE